MWFGRTSLRVSTDNKLDMNESSSYLSVNTTGITRWCIVKERRRLKAAKHTERKIDVLEQPLPRSLYRYPLRLSLLEVLFTFTLGSRGR